MWEHLQAPNIPIKGRDAIIQKRLVWGYPLQNRCWGIVGKGLCLKDAARQCYDIKIIHNHVGVHRVGLSVSRPCQLLLYLLGALISCTDLTRLHTARVFTINSMFELTSGLADKLCLQEWALASPGAFRGGGGGSPPSGSASGFEAGAQLEA